MCYQTFFIFKCGFTYSKYRIYRKHKSNKSSSISELSRSMRALHDLLHRELLQLCHRRSDWLLTTLPMRPRTCSICVKPGENAADGLETSGTVVPQHPLKQSITPCSPTAPLCRATLWGRTPDSITLSLPCVVVSFGWLSPVGLIWDVCDVPHLEAFREAEDFSQTRCLTFQVKRSGVEVERLQSSLPVQIEAAPWPTPLKRTTVSLR